MEFEKRLNTVVRILKDNNVTEQGKERVYDDFLRDFPFFDSSKLDKYFK